MMSMAVFAMCCAARDHAAQLSEATPPASARARLNLVWVTARAIIAAPPLNESRPHPETAGTRALLAVPPGLIGRACRADVVELRGLEPLTPHCQCRFGPPDRPSPTSPNAREPGSSCTDAVSAVVGRPGASGAWFDVDEQVGVVESLAGIADDAVPDVLPDLGLGDRRPSRPRPAPSSPFGDGEQLDGPWCRVVSFLVAGSV